MAPSQLSRLCLLWCASVSGCAVYHAEPLPDDDALLSDITMLRSAEGATLPLDFSNGVDFDEVAVVAVLNNPGLRAARAAKGVARAQVFAAGLLPDPQVTVGSDNPTNQTDTQVNAYTFTVGYDVGALVTRDATTAAAAAAAEQVRLDVVWQEWQVAQQARIAATRYRTETRKLSVLLAARAQFEARASASTHALESGDVTVDVAGTDLNALLDIDNRLYQLQMQHNDTAHEIRALLGLQPEASLDIAMTDGTPALPASIDVGAVAKQRPDLQALRAGYESQEARVRAAIWRQFPAVTLTWSRLRDTSSVWTSGLGATLNLPVFSGARGDIAIEQATRAKLRAEYQDRLAQTHSDTARLLAAGAIAQRQLDDVRAQMPSLETMVEQARRGYSAGDLDAVVSINLETTLVTHEIEQIELEQTLWETAIALDTVLGRQTR